MIFVIIVFQRK